MDSAVRRIGVLTSGGDAPGMNAAIRAVTRTALHLGIECVGIRRGFNGLINGDEEILDYARVSGISRMGGTMLYSARSKEFQTEEGIQKAVNTCKLLGLDGIVGIGGDGTFRGLHDLSDHGIAVIGVPGTIDNDISCSTYTLGYDTACNTAVECIDKLQDTMQSHERCSVVEVMGHRAGHLALYVGVACGATSVLIPEKEVSFEEDVLEPIRRARLGGRTHFMVIVAEGVEGGAYEVGNKIKEATALDTRVTVLGHIQRGGSPTARDRVTATYMGYDAVMLLASGKTDRVVCMQNDSYVDFDITEALSMKKGIDEQNYTVMRTLIGGPNFSMVRKHK